MRLIPWSERTKEEAFLFNPSFINGIICFIAFGYQNEADKGIPIQIIYLIMPLVLHKRTRDALPRTVKTTLASWVKNNIQIKFNFPERINSLVPLVNEAILFGVGNHFLEFNNGVIISRLPKKYLQKIIDNTSGEVRECFSRSIFLGKWIAKSGTYSTIMNLLGVKL